VHGAADSEVVAQPLAELSWAATVVEGGSEPQWAQKAYTATGAALGIAAVCAFRGEQDHGTDHWEQLARLAATSAGHPVIGNLATAGCAALLVGKLGSERLRTSHFGQNALKWLGRHMLAASVIVTTVGDVATEISQSYLVTNGPILSSFEGGQIPETVKDYLFALLGIMVFYGQAKVHGWWQRWRQTKRTDSGEATTEIMEAAA